MSQQLSRRTGSAATIRRPRGRPPHADVLTPAEWRVVEAVRHGMSNPQIARRQGVSLDAVKFHVANALGKLGLPDRRSLRRWDGVSAGSALKRAARTAPSHPQEARMQGLQQIARNVADLEAAKAWYGEVLGLPLLYAFPGMAFFDLGGVRLYLQQSENSGPESVLYFRVGDIHAVWQGLEAKGVSFVNAPHMIHRHPDGAEEWLCEFRDPEDRPMALMSRVAAAADA